ncbi:4-fold beta flower protein [Pseudomonas muyukensis]|uniref:4-fold beta flower protein n=1 Tax=Pseudomonas muyukensis TaxID=2842357 RepID=UPI000FA88C38
MPLNFYDRAGTPIAYTDDGEHIFTISGRPVAYLNDGSVYSYQGRHLGLMAEGVIRDNSGHVALFTEGARLGVTRPMLRLMPLKGLKQLKPLKQLRQLRPLKPLNRMTWSQLSGQKFFF